MSRGLLPGDVVSCYRIEDALGEGGFSVVFKAYDEDLKRYVAIKALKSEFLAAPEFVERFRRGAKALARTNHPHIVRVFKTLETEYGPCLVMELLAYPTLKQALRKEVLPLPQALLYAETIGLAMAHAHSKGVVHRDLKPQNIMVLPDGQLKVFDFGIALMTGSQFNTSTSEKLVIGTPEYMSPEQCIGDKVDHRTDVYSLGVILFELIAGRPPFLNLHGDSDAVRYMHRYEPVPSPRAWNKRITPEVERVVLKALSKNKDQRYGNLKAMVIDIRRCRMSLEGGAALSVGPVEPGGSFRVARSSVVGAGVAFGILLVCLAMSFPPTRAAKKSVPPPPEAGGRPAPASHIPPAAESVPSPTVGPMDPSPIPHPDRRGISGQASGRTSGSLDKAPPTPGASSCPASPTSVPLSALDPTPLRSVPGPLFPTPTSVAKPPIDPRGAPPSSVDSGKSLFATAMDRAMADDAARARVLFAEAETRFKEGAQEDDEVWAFVRLSENARDLCEKMCHHQITEAFFRASMGVLKAEMLEESE